MSFKSKQRAKHGHLFGDDPLNASSSPNSPTDSLPRSSSPTDGSIFGGIDVSKLNHKRTTSLRSASKLVDDDSLFGKTRRTPPSPPPRVASPHKDDGPLVVKKPPPPPPPPRRPVSVSSSRTSVSSPSPSIPSSPVLSKSPPPTGTVPPPPPPRTHIKHQQQTIHTAIPVKQIDEPISDNESEEARIMQQQKAAMMQDEATRAFAMDPPPTLNSTTISYDADDPDLVASIVSPFLAMSTSSSTPTPANNSNNPWLGPSPAATTTTPLPREKDMAPAKRAAFADLIANWHGNPAPPDEQDEDGFLASTEQQDIGFSRIDTSSSSIVWRQDGLLDDNPWS